MKKKELLKKVEEALHTEEEAIEVYMHHMQAFETRLEITPAEHKKVESFMKKMIHESKGHKKACLEIIKYIKKQDKDDF